MHRFTMLAVAAGAALAGGVVATQVQAQGAGPGAGPAAGMERPGMERPGMARDGGGMRRIGEHGRMYGMMRRLRQFALVYPAADRALSGPDVQKIAEALLLYNGNHTWKVTEVVEQPTRVTFAFASPDGAAIAHFAMDRHTARPERID